MGGFNYKDIYKEDGQRVLEMNVLPEKHCNFDCIFCPIGRSYNKVDTPQSFEATNDSLMELGNRLERDKVDLVFINSKGEALVNDKIRGIIEYIKGKGLNVRLLSNGYLLNRNEYKEVANMCEEVIGELKVISNEDFQKIQRPIGGYTFENHISNMQAFREQYNGKFILEVTILKGYNDSEESVIKMKKIIEKISPDKIIVVAMDDERFSQKLGVNKVRLDEITKVLINKS